MKTSTIRKSNLVREFVSVPNSTAQDVNLSWGARGLLTYLLSKPATWRINISHLSGESKCNGRDATSKLLSELINKKYIHKGKIRTNGRFSGYEYVVYDFPHEIVGSSIPDLPFTENPYTENPETENQEIDLPFTENPYTENPETEKPNTENPQLEKKEYRKERNKKERNRNFATEVATSPLGKPKNFQGEMIDVWASIYKHRIGEDPKLKRTKDEYIALAEFSAHVNPKLKDGETVIDKWASYCEKAWALNNEFIRSNFTPGTLWRMYDRIIAEIAQNKAKKLAKGQLPILQQGEKSTSGIIQKPFQNK